VNTTQVNRVTAAVDIGNIRLVALRAETNVREVKAPGEAQINVNYKSGLPEPVHPDGSFVVFVEFNVGVMTAEDPEPKFSVMAAFEIAYRLRENTEYTEEEMKQFASTNAVFNAWPYLRETVQSILARMNLPAVVLPLFRYGKGAASAEPKTT
jgi:preprotein translocase subunit SecB